MTTQKILINKGDICTTFNGVVSGTVALSIDEIRDLAKRADKIELQENIRKYCSCDHCWVSGDCRIQQFAKSMGISSFGCLLQSHREF